MRLPAPRDPASYSLAVVCLGNICRSPMAHVILEDRIEAAGLAGRVSVRSAGTGGWHVGKAMDPRAASTLRATGYDPSRHRAQQFHPDWYADTDLVLAMDGSNLADLQHDDVDPGRLLRFRDFDPAATDRERDVPDPYFGDDDGFDTVLAMVERTVDQIVSQIVDQLAALIAEQAAEKISDPLG